MEKELASSSDREEGSRSRRSRGSEYSPDDSGRRSKHRSKWVLFGVSFLRPTRFERDRCLCDLFLGADRDRPGPESDPITAAGRVPRPDLRSENTRRSVTSVTSPSSYLSRSLYGVHLLPIFLCFLSLFLGCIHLLLSSVISCFCWIMNETNPLLQFQPVSYGHSLLYWDKGLIDLRFRLLAKGFTIRSWEI